MIAKGISLLSEDRKNEGLALNRTIAENITFSTLKKIGKFGLVGNNTIDSIANQWREQLSIKLGKVTDRADSLSGGNQQKVALARILEHDSDVLLLDEPTRGVDVGSKVEIYRWIGQLAARGKGIVFVSSYLPELLGVCDTLAVMHRGRLSAKKTVADWTEHEIMRLAAAGGA
ncbi:MAG: Ribose import ATP-binding protein RbsA [candidate division BRC1 bacterium ADurb.BinA364]|nr:MAG: Ribose import ATP-binding protein RbsA [candidate division BRC1 bacterium ADurb.BinA364]